MTTQLSERDDFATLFTSDTPLIDTRAPAEFTQGAFPHSDNLPLMTDDERAQVGICYKQQGKEAALALGHHLVRDELKTQRVAAWADFMHKHPEGALYCFRGGLRSQISQQWLYEYTGIAYPRIKGGYKAMRRFLLHHLENTSITPIVLAGQTGCGKTRLLKKLPHPIDLEGLANHRGSAFGPTTTSQPSPIDFENALSVQLLKHQHAPFSVFEDEGTHIGSLNVPKPIYHACQQADIVLLHASLAERLQLTLEEYVVDMHQAFVRRDGISAGFHAFCHYFQGSLNKIKKRLGGAKHQALSQLTQHAFATQQKTGSTEAYLPVLEQLLRDYYDPMYQYQLNKKQDRIVFQGNAQEIQAYLTELKSHQV